MELGGLLAREALVAAALAEGEVACTEADASASSSSTCRSVEWELRAGYALLTAGKCG